MEHAGLWYGIIMKMLQCSSEIPLTLHWRHNDHAGVSNHQPDDCLLNRLFRRRSKKTSKLRVTGPLCGEFTGTGEFPAQRASYAENVSIWWRHHETLAKRSCNSWWPNNPICRHITWSSLVQAMACCLTVPIHYLNQCWLSISEVRWHSHESTFTVCQS